MAGSFTNQPSQHQPLQTIGLFGGTFDPVHIGHLRIALELKQHLGLDQMRLVPCHIPPHRQTPVATAAQREKMVELALAANTELSLDRVELDNPEPSYSVHTLSEIRRSEGDGVSLCLAMGMDSLVNIGTWYRWREILELAHIVVAARPGWQLPQQGEVADYFNQHRGEIADLKNRPAGSIVVQELTLLPISSTTIRQQISDGLSAQFLLPDLVWNYIQQHQLYGIA